SRVGVLAYSQEHAREWATPLVTLEFAERMLANARTDPATRELLEQVDIFVIPMVNPDGANYSFNDFNFQRKNLVNHCTGPARDPKNRTSWGVDINRNYTVGSYFDGYVGGSANCLSGTYSGTAELSEAESSNVIALAQAHQNIKFAMNVHSYGGYFMWPPGAYRADGRITLPRPSIDESTLFLNSARRIVGAIAQERGTVTWPSQTGPVADVLYSAAGNSADQLYYELGIFAWDFEVGNDRWNAATSEWEGVGFQPPFDEAHGESQEYAGGLVEMVRVARDYAAAESAG
ncbi:M14 family zinc carboxypeptidase, partial [Micromonospora luteifusca]|uniref:M14 family zinc carboxypeptidase n=1 Tax=Micromonospora luteifusca TaxID=709860 RepID=UPI0033BF9EC5